MAEQIPKITAEQLAQKGVVAAPDRLTGNPQENKMVFDRLIREVVAVAVNMAIDVLNEMIPAENDRETAEAGRASAEEKRAQAEADRVTAEKGREDAEGRRATAETERNKAEEARNRAEQERVNTTDGIVAQAAQQAQAAAASASQASRFVTDAAAEVTKAKEQVTEAANQVKLAEKEVDHANEKVEDAEAWAKGTRNGVEVDENDPTYQNNAKYYSEQAESTVGPKVTPEQLNEAIKTVNQRIEGVSQEVEEVASSAKSGNLGGGCFTGELEDVDFRMGSLVNTGAEWNSYSFPTSFEGTPHVILQPESFNGWVQIKNVNPDGFLYCLRKFQEGQNGAEGSVTSGSYYTASGTSSSSGHTKNTLVNAVTLPGAPVLPTTDTTEEPVVIHWFAFEFNGEE